MGLNPEQDYAAQLAPLATNGELANGPKRNQTLFSLCQIVDRQNREIQALKDDRATIAAEMVKLSKLVTTPAVDPTKPLDAPANTTSHDPNELI